MFCIVYVLWFNADTTHFCVHQYKICGESSADLSDEKQRF